MSADRFIRLPEGLEFTDLSAADFRTLCALAKHANWKTGILRVKQETLAGETGLHLTTIRKCMATLIAKGIVDLMKRTGRSNQYRIVYEWVAVSPPQTERDDHLRGGHLATPEVAVSPPLRNESVLNENDSNDSSVSPPVPETEFQSETDAQVALLAEELGAVEIKRESEGITENSATAPGVVGMSRLTPEQAQEKFNPDNYDPVKAQAEMDGLRKALDTTSVTAPPGQMVSAEKMQALGRARTSRPLKFPPAFDPALVGYTEQLFKAEFPLLDFSHTVNGFVAHHMSKGDVSENWLGKFLTYAQIGQRKAMEERQTSGDNEPPVNRAATWDAKRKQMFKEQANPGEGYAAWQVRMEREGVVLP